MKNKNKKSITILAVVFGFLLLILALIWFTFTDIQKKCKDLILIKNNIATLTSQAEEMSNFKKNYETYKPNLEKIDQLFVDPNNLVTFIEFLESTASGSGVDSKIYPPTSSSQTDQGLITLQISLKGSSSQIVNFIRKIEFADYFLEIESLNMQNSKDSQGPDIFKKYASGDYSSREVDAELTINAYTKQ